MSWSVAMDPVTAIGTIRNPTGPATQRTPAGEPKLLAGVRGPAQRAGRDRQLNESPQAQEPPAFGLSIVKPCFSMLSTKSITAPCRYGALMRSTPTLRA